MKLITRAEYEDQVAKAMTERTLQDRVLAIARAAGWLSYHTHDSRRSQPGFPDLVLVHAGKRRVLYRELKSQTGRVSPEQTLWLDALTAAGEDAGVWRPIDLLTSAIHRDLTRTPREESPRA